MELLFVALSKIIDSLLGKFLEDNTPSLSIRKYLHAFSGNHHSIRYHETYLAKICLLSPMARLYEISEFDQDVMTKGYTDVFYDVAIYVTKRLELDTTEFWYYSKNYLAHSIENKDQLIGYLLKERENPSRNDSRYQLGFRSICFILSRNLTKISSIELCEINSKLEPFYAAYRNKYLLVPGN